ncbi:hypothetical protein BGX29_008448, partial [Mortierella sp. GBA35]
MLQEDLPMENVQAVRSISKSSLDSPTNSTPATGATVYVDTHTDPATLKEFVLWEDIQLVFEDALYVRHRAKVVPFLKGDDLRTLEPRRIAAVPNAILDVVMPDPPVPSMVAPQSSALQRIEQHASRLPRHDPMTTLRPPTRILVPQSSNRTPLETPSAQMCNRQLVLKTAKAAIGKIGVHVDLIELHMKGDGAPDDFFKALGCYLRSVHHGHAYAQVSVGNLFLDGKGVPQDSAMAMKWYRETDNLGDAAARAKIDQAQLATAPLSRTTQPSHQSDNRKPTEIRPYSYAMPSAQVLELASVESRLNDDTPVESRPANDHKPLTSSHILTAASTANGIATKILAASQGDRDAQVTLGNKHRNGDSVEKDNEAAHYWCLKAANNGDPSAQNIIGDIYRLGQGVPQDLSTAMDWYLKAAEQGDAAAQYN